MLTQYVVLVFVHHRVREIAAVGYYQRSTATVEQAARPCRAYRTGVPDNTGERVVASYLSVEMQKLASGRTLVHSASTKQRN
jgi:hypothetical protein